MSFGLAGMFLAISLYMAHHHAPLLFLIVSLGIAILAQAWSVWIMCERHWKDWRRRAPTSKR